MVSPKSIVFVLVAVVLSTQARFLPEVVSRVISDVATHFNGNCVLLINFVGSNPSLSDGRRHVLVRKLLSKLGIESGMINEADLTNYNKTHRQFRCKQSRPLYVALLSDDEASVFTPTKKIPSHPRWLVFAAGVRAHPPDLLHGLHVPFDCELLVASGAGADVLLTEAYHVTPESTLHSARFAMWRPTGGLRPSRPAFLYARRRDLHGLVLKAAVVNFPPTAILVVNSEGEKEFSGFIGDIWNALQSNFNFRTVLTEPMGEGNKWGQVYANGSWSGGIGMILSKSVDFTLSDFTYTTERMNVIDFLTPVLTSSTNLAIRNPDSKGFKWYIFLEPFTLELWSAILLSVVLLGVVLSSVRSAGRRHGNEVAESLDPADHVVDALLQVAGLFSQQGQSSPPASSSSRIVYLIACLSAIVILASYSGAIVSSLANQTETFPFSTLQGLLDHAQYSVVFMDKVVFSIIFQNKENDPFLQHLHSRTLPEELPLERICTEVLAFIGSGTYFKRIVKEVPCKTMWFPESLLTQHLSLVVDKNSHFKKFFNYNLGRLREGGVIDRIHKTNWPSVSQKQEPEGAEVRPVEVAQVLPALAALSVVTVAALCMLAFERRVKRAAKISSRTYHRRTKQFNLRKKET